MKKYKLIACAGSGIRKTKIITAENYNEAQRIAWEVFPEFDDCWIIEVQDE